MNKRLLSMFLALCMIVSMLPVTAMAEEIPPIGTSGEITSFAPLTETAKAASLGTSIEDLELPETLTATVRTAVTPADKPVQDSGSPETATPTTAAEPEWVENTVDISVKWESTPEYDMDTEGAYVFTPVIEGYTVSATLPEITVTVGEIPPIAAVVLDSGGAAKDSYDTFENALYHAETGETVKLLKEITLAAPASITDKSIILDLNGKKLTSAWPQTLTYTGTSDKTLTITDSADGGVVENTYGSKEGKALVNNSTGTVEVLGGTIRSTGVYGYGIHNASTGTITVSGGSVEATGDQYASMYYYYRARAIDNSGGGVVNISGTAQVTGVTGNGYAITSNKASGVVNISGGVVSSENNFALGGSESGRIKGRVNITGGEIRSGIDLANGTTVNISGGTLAPGKISVPVDSTLVITGGNMGFNLYGGVAVNGQVPPVTVVPYVLTIPGEGNKAVTELTVTPELDYTYGMNDVKTDDSGNLTVCLPLGKTGVSVTIDGTTYSGETVRVSEEYSNWGYTATLTPPAPSYTVTFNPNGGTVSETSRSVASGAAVGTLPTPTRSGSYSFDGWYTAASGGTQISASTTVSANVTYHAHWTYTSGGGSGSGDGSSSNDNSSPVIVTPPAPDKPNSPTQGEIKVPGTADGNGNITVNISDKTVADAFDKALSDARKTGSEQNGITLVLQADSGSKTASNVTINLPKTVQDTIIAKKIVNTIVVVDNPDIRIGMDLATVQEINKQARADVNLTATRMNNSALTGDAASAIGARPVFDLKVNYGSNQVQNFGAGSVSVTIPYTLGANETPGNIQAVYVDANGRMQWLVNSVYDSLNGVLRFSTNHFSTYGVGNKQGAPVFSDVSTHWAADDIAFVANRGLLSGTSKTTFSPNTAMTRGMFVTALGRLANANVSGYTKSSFNDVKRDAYYMGYIEWANKNNIVNGVGNGRFAPDQSITREQMAVIMQGYAKTIGYTLPKVHVENTFADNAKISAYAKEAVKQMQMAGVISGKNSNLFDPQGTATRAEVSAVLRRFVELAISSNTAQGWTMNDSGKWMYYENGKPLTGKQDIDGATYTFDQYGVTADVPKNLRYTTYTVQKGDSFWRIAHKLGCTMSELERLNNKSRFSLIHPGDVLRVPEK